MNTSQLISQCGYTKMNKQKPMSLGPKIKSCNAKMWASWKCFPPIIKDRQSYLQDPWIHMIAMHAKKKKKGIMLQLHAINTM